METVILGLGSNVGERRANIEAAVGALGEAGARVLKVSSFYATSPVGGPVQGDFINAAALVRTRLEPGELLVAVKSIEKQLGRDADVERWGPRVIDIDIIFYGRRRVNEADLVIPHEMFAQRLFVLVPAVEIAPDFVTPDGVALGEFFETRRKETDFFCQDIEKLL